MTKNATIGRAEYLASVQPGDLVTIERMGAPYDLENTQRIAVVSESDDLHFVADGHRFNRDGGWTKKASDPIKPGTYRADKPHPELMAGYEEAE